MWSIMSLIIILQFWVQNRITLINLHFFSPNIDVGTYKNFLFGLFMMYLHLITFFFFLMRIDDISYCKWNTFSWNNWLNLWSTPFSNRQKSFQIPFDYNNPFVFYILQGDSHIVCAHPNIFSTIMRFYSKSDFCNF